MHTAKSRALSAARQNIRNSIRKTSRTRVGPLGFDVFKDWKMSLLSFYFLCSITQIVTSTVFLNQAEEGVAVCRVAMVLTNITCTTTTPDGFLTWRNSSGVGFNFGDSTSVNVGITGTLGSTIMTLNNIEHVSGAVVYTSTATENMIENTTIQCSDGGASQSIDITVKSPSSPSWGYSACKFSHGSVRFFWNAPSVSPECCDHYTLQLSTGSVNATDTSITVPLVGDSITATVYCVDGSGEMVTKTQAMTIYTNPVIERITIEHLNNNSCDANAIYHISWSTNASLQDMCTPPIATSTIRCVTPSTHQSSNNSGSTICYVPANETIDVTVTVTNAAGFNTSMSATADASALTYQRRCMCNTPEPMCNQLSPAAVAAVIISLVALVIAVVSIVFVIYVKLKFIRPLKRTSDKETKL